MDVATDPGHASGSDDVSQARVVVGVDGSDSSIDALRWAARLAPSLGATIDATIAWHPAHTYGFYPYPADYRPPDQEAAEMLSDAIAGAFDGVPPAGIVESVREGHPPSQVLIDAARHAQMLVLGSRGHGGFSGLLLARSAPTAPNTPPPVRFWWCARKPEPPSSDGNRDHAVAADPASKARADGSLRSMIGSLRSMIAVGECDRSEPGRDSDGPAHG